MGSAAFYSLLRLDFWGSDQSPPYYQKVIDAILTAGNRPPGPDGPAETPFYWSGFAFAARSTTSAPSKSKTSMADSSAAAASPSSARNS